MRDHTLAAQLKDAGHEVLVASMYLPLLLDRHDPALEGPLFFGGLNCYLQQVSPLFRRTPRWVDAWFDRNSVLNKIGKKASSTQAKGLGEMTLSMLRGEAGNQVKEVRRLVQWIAEEYRPDVVVLSNALLTGVAPAIKAACNATVVCTLQGEKSFIDDYPPEWRERIVDQLKANRAGVDVYMAVSESYRQSMSILLDLSPSHGVAVLNGIDVADFPVATYPPATPVIGFLSRMCHAKGIDRFVDAFIELATQPGMGTVKAAIGGSQTQADRKITDACKSRLQAAGLADRVSWHPNLNLTEKVNFLRRCSFLTVPLRYEEAFGLYVAEAMSCGVPLVLPRKGSFPEIVESNGAGILYEDESPQGIAAAWKGALESPTLSTLRENLPSMAREKFCSVRMARDFLNALPG